MTAVCTATSPTCSKPSSSSVSYSRSSHHSSSSRAGCWLLRRRLLCGSLALLVLLQCLCVSSAASISLRALEPQRPNKFKNVEELRQYLKELHEYYSVVGRPRFGRSVEIPYLEDALRGTPILIPYRRFLTASRLPYKHSATSDFAEDDDLTY